MIERAPGSRQGGIHTSASVGACDLGEGVSIGPNAWIGDRTTIGSLTRIAAGARLEDSVNVGVGVTIGANAFLSQGVEIGDGTDVGPHVVFAVHGQRESGGSEVEVRRSRVEFAEPSRVGKYVSIGSNSTVFPGVALGDSSTILPGSVVTENVPPHAVVSGNPAVILRYSGAETVREVRHSTSTVEMAELPGGARILPLTTARDLRGSLSALEFHSLPWNPKRLFVVHDVPTIETRGEHAHHECEQFLIALRGEISVLLDDGNHRTTVRLATPSLGLLMPPLVWGTQFHFSHEAVLAVLASRPYEARDYIRTYEEFLTIVRPET